MVNSGARFNSKVMNGRNTQEGLVELPFYCERTGSSLPWHCMWRLTYAKCHSRQSGDVILLDGFHSNACVAHFSAPLFRVYRLPILITVLSEATGYNPTTFDFELYIYT